MSTLLPKRSVVLVVSNIDINWRPESRGSRTYTSYSRRDRRINLHTVPWQRVEQLECLKTREPRQVTLLPRISTVEQQYKTGTKKIWKTQRKITGQQTRVSLARGSPIEDRPEWEAERNGKLKTELRRPHSKRESRCSSLNETAIERDRKTLLILNSILVRNVLWSQVIERIKDDPIVIQSLTILKILGIYFCQWREHLLNLPVNMNINKIKIAFVFLKCNLSDWPLFFYKLWR